MQHVLIGMQVYACYIGHAFLEQHCGACCLALLSCVLSYISMHTKKQHLTAICFANKQWGGMNFAKWPVDSNQVAAG